MQPLSKEPEKTINNNTSIYFEKGNTPDFVQENNQLKETIRKLNKSILDKESQINEGKSQLNGLIHENKVLQENSKFFEQNLMIYSSKAKEVLCKLLIDSEKIKRREIKSHLYTQRERLGEYVSQR